MAIIVEEEKKPANLSVIASTVVVIAVLFIGSYLLFFKKPELIDIVSSGSANDLNRISKLNFNPEDVVNNPVFKSLRQFGGSVPNLTPGRSNPFKPF